SRVARHPGGTPRRDLPARGGPDSSPGPTADDRRRLRHRTGAARCGAGARRACDQHRDDEPIAVRTHGLSGTMLPAIRDGTSLNQALDLGYRQLLLERGSLLAIL